MAPSGRLLCLALALAAVGARIAAAATGCTPGSVTLALTGADAPSAAYPTCFARFDVTVGPACDLTVTPAAAAGFWSYSALWMPSGLAVQDTNQQVGAGAGRGAVGAAVGAAVGGRGHQQQPGRRDQCALAGRPVGCALTPATSSPPRPVPPCPANPPPRPSPPSFHCRPAPHRPCRAAPSPTRAPRRWRAPSRRPWARPCLPVLMPCSLLLFKPTAWRLPRAWPATMPCPTRLWW